MRKAFNHYASIHEIKKQLNDKQYILFDRALCEVQFLEKHIEDVAFEDPLLKLLWTSIKHTVRSNIDGYCSKMKIDYESLFQGDKNTPCQGGSQGGRQQEKEKEKEKEKGCRLENLPKLEKSSLYEFMKSHCIEKKIDLIEIEKFTDYWKSQTNQKAIKKDWKATFRNWCRSEWVKKDSSSLNEVDWLEVNGLKAN